MKSATKLRVAPSANLLAKNSPAKSLKEAKEEVEKDPLLIQEMFGKIARRYDRANSALSLLLHKYWNGRLVRSLKPAEVLLDLCAGTGEIAYTWLAYAEKKQKTKKTAFLLDFCEEMLDAARSKSLPYILKGHALHFIRADATSIPLPSCSIDLITISYGIRNVQDPFKCFQEAYRVLKSNGELSILELTEPRNPLLKRLHCLYLAKVLPWLGGIITKEKAAYRYLASSIPAFSKPTEIKQQLEAAGFRSISITPLSGGIATLIQASK